MRGLVQGVGFRPFVWRVANGAGLIGEVLNDAQGVIIRLCCEPPELAELLERLERDIPPLARIDTVETQPYTGNESWQDFSIVASGAGQIATGIVPDAAICTDCLADIKDPQNRRFGYGFTNCTNCGPRLSITRAIPYDRGTTSMASFEMCAACQAEYDDPSDRRFHAQPNACPTCGPKLTLVGSDGPVEGDPIALAAAAITAGKIVAIKGLGGFQLAVDAGNSEAVKLLRSRKCRPAKPLACMARDLAMVARYVSLDDVACDLLQSPQAPIVLARSKGQALAPEVAPNQNRLGFMLPNTPLHQLMFQYLDRPIVLTSGNLSDEPQVTDNAQALSKLASIADLWLTHDRDIVNRLDDSVVQIVDGTAQTMRRARGYAPAPHLLHPGFDAAPSVLAVGADLKNTFCLLQGCQAIVSQHMGDMQNPQTQRGFIENLKLYRQLYDFTPSLIAVDQHPDYFSTRRGREIAAQENLETSSVQHHHAHIAAVLADRGFAPDAKPVLGIVLDGLGKGGDETIWGGEFLLASFHSYERVAHIQPVALLGGEKANLQPWRNAVAHLWAAYGPEAIPDLLTEYGEIAALKSLQNKPLVTLAQMLERGINVPLASSTGRLFDAVAAMLGIGFETVQFEGQVATELQALAETCPNENGAYPIPIRTPIKWTALWDGILGDLEKSTDLNIIAARFHNSLAMVFTAMAFEITSKSNIKTVVLCGGVMQNALLLEKLHKGLGELGLETLSAREFPVNDGAISLGQAAILAARNCSVDRD